MGGTGAPPSRFRVSLPPETEDDEEEGSLVVAKEKRKIFLFLPIRARSHSPRGDSPPRHHRRQRTTGKPNQGHRPLREEVPHRNAPRTVRTRPRGSTGRTETVPIGRNSNRRVGTGGRGDRGRGMPGAEGGRCFSYSSSRGSCTCGEGVTHRVSTGTPFRRGDSTPGGPLRNAWAGPVGRRSKTATLVWGRVTGGPAGARTTENDSTRRGIGARHLRRGGPPRRHARALPARTTAEQDLATGAERLEIR